MKLVKPVFYVVVALLATVVLAVVLLAFAPPRWLGEQASRFGSDALGVPLKVERLDIQPFSLTPAVEVSGVDLGSGPGPQGADEGAIAGPVSNLGGRVAVDLLAGLRGTLLFDRISVRDGELTLRRDADGVTNLDALRARFAADPDAAPEPDPPADEPVSLPAIRALSISDTTLSLQDAMTGTEADLAVRADGSTLSAEAPMRLNVDGRAARGGDEAEVSLAARLASSTPPREGIGDLDIDVQAGLGNLSAGIVGQVLDADRDAAAALDITLAGDSLDIVQAFTGVELPAVPAFRLTGALSNEGSDITLQRFDATLGDSRFEGDIRLDPSKAPVSLFANIIFTAVDLDELLAIAVGDGVETADQDEQEQEVIAGESQGWFPDRALGLKALSGTFDGQIRVRAEGIESRWPLDAVDVGLALRGDRIDVAPLEASVAGGQIDGKAGIDTAGEQPEGTLELAVQRLELVRIVEALGIDDDSAGVLGGRLRYWFRGDNVADMAGSLDGGTFLLMTGGRLDALLTELAGLDLVESVMLLADPGKTLTPIDCAYVDVLATDGVVDLQRFVVDTSDTVVVADGTVDLGAQTFDLAVEPHAKDTSFISAQGPVAIASDGEDISIRPGPDMVARTALAGLLASVATPAAALLPFVRPGSGEDSVYCDGLVEKLDEQR